MQFSSVLQLDVKYYEMNVNKQSETSFEVVNPADLQAM